MKSAQQIAVGASTASARERAPSTCAHCGLPVPPALRRAESTEQFCCNGCEQVYRLLHQWGCDQYYRIRESLPAERRQPRRTGRSYDDYDDPQFEREYVERSPRGTRKVRLYLEGVHCAACVWLVEELPRFVDGLCTSRLCFSSSVVDVEWDPDRTKLSAVARALDSIGYPPHPHRGAEATEARRREDRTLVVQLGVAAACAMNIMFLQGALYAGELQGMERAFEHFFRWLGLALTLPVMLYAARPFFRAAWAALRHRVPHMDLPIAIALAVAFVWSARSTIVGSGPVYFDSVAALVALLLGSRVLQRRAHRAAIERASGLRSAAFVEFARRLAPAHSSGAEPNEAVAVPEEVTLGALRRGDLVEVRSGELVPVDGIVTQGSSFLDNAALTGESRAVPVRTTDRVYAGATNLGSRLVVEVEAAGAATRVGALLALVEDAMAKRAPIVDAADRLSRAFVLVVLGLAVATGLWWARISPSLALEQTVALLVVTCPCALGLATPVAISVGLARAARAGIFVKNPAVLEQLRDVGVVVLDKTGTLTDGKATVGQWLGDERAVELARALESESSHPIAEAFRRSPPRAVAAVRAVADVVELAGCGIAGRVDGQQVGVGSHALVRRLGAELPSGLAAHGDALAEAGSSPLYVVVEGVVAAVGGVGDRMRPDARATVEALGRRGIEVRVLSGDDPRVVARVAEELGLPPERCLGGLTPEDKRDRIAEWTGAPRGAAAPAARLAREGSARVASASERRAIAMVGDGVNDAAAMALADIGIAVHGGAGASIVAADVVLTRPGLAPLLDVLTGARQVIGVVRRNFVFSLLYNLVGASLAVAGLVGPLVAALLMPASSLTVVLSTIVARPFRMASHRPPTGQRPTALASEGAPP